MGENSVDSKEDSRQTPGCVSLIILGIVCIVGFVVGAMIGSFFGFMANEPTEDVFTHALIGGVAFAIITGGVTFMSIAANK